MGWLLWKLHEFELVGVNEEKIVCNQMVLGSQLFQFVGPLGQSKDWVEAEFVEGIPVIEGEVEGRDHREQCFFDHHKSLRKLVI